MNMSEHNVGRISTSVSKFSSDKACEQLLVLFRANERFFTVWSFCKEDIYIKDNERTIRKKQEVLPQETKINEIGCISLGILLI